MEKHHIVILKMKEYGITPIKMELLPHAHWNFVPWTRQIRAIQIIFAAIISFSQ